jgi:hypothetical protein
MYATDAGLTASPEQKNANPGGVMQANTFDATVHNLERLHLTDSQSALELCNWGELFLHPDLRNIIRIINDRSSVFDQHERIDSPPDRRCGCEESHRWQILNVRVPPAVIRSNPQIRIRPYQGEYQCNRLPSTILLV